MATLNELAAALQDGRTSARELVQNSLDKIADVAGEGARTFLSVDGEAALAEADHIDAQRKRGSHASPYAGIPMSVKDLFDMAGQVTRAGSTVLNDAAPAKADAVAIARLKAAGFIAVGRTNMTEFAYSGVGLNPHYGTPLSVYDRKNGRIPGGSSSGAAVSVAESMCALGIGTDTGGSCRIPAAFNGIVGYKSSVGRVPKTGVYPLSKTLDSVGPLANSVACCAVADALMAGDWDGQIKPREASTIRLAIIRDVFFDDIEDEIASAFDNTIVRLGRSGVQLSDISFAGLSELPAINAKGGIAAAEAYAHHKELIASHGAQYDQRVRTRIESGAVITASELQGVHRKRNEFIIKADELSVDFDGWLMPTTPNVPPLIADFETFEAYGRLNFRCLRNTFVGNFLNRCAISIPISDRGNAPAGGMIMAPWGHDHSLFSVANCLEGVLKP